MSKLDLIMHETHTNRETGTHDFGEIISVKTFLEKDKLRIPEYQRPYKWEAKHVEQLIDDIFNHRYKSKYRIGTIVIHSNTMGSTLCHDIVDGQQRYTTLRIILFALFDIVQQEDCFKEDSKNRIEQLKKKVEAVNIEYTNRTSIQNIRNNYSIAKRLLRKYDDQALHCFMNTCEIVVFTITDITEAFQFFDSQNARGKDLYPHDLLKAFHLREFEKDEIVAQTKIVSDWESYESEELAAVFANYLYRIKGWTSKDSARFFSKNDIYMFKGVNLNQIQNFPYTRVLQMANSFVEEYNQSYHHKIDKANVAFPFQLDAVMINGKRFFEYVAHYKYIVDSFKKEYLPEGADTKDQTNLFFLVYHNAKAYRAGEKFIQMVFECVLIYYVDKFGKAEFEVFAEKAFIWCFCLRFMYQRLGFDSVDNYVLQNNLLLAIKEALVPAHVLKFKINSLPNSKSLDSFIEDNNRMDSRIADFFKSKAYYEN